MDTYARVPLAFDYYRDVFDRRTPEELRTIAQIKRFVELLAGDEVFRQALQDSPVVARRITCERGIDLDPNELSPFWRNGVHPVVEKELVKDSPQAKMWTEWIDDLIKFRELMRESARTTEANPRFDSWRLRQVARCDSELGDCAKGIVHSVVVFELSEGCSMGCWFCGLKAEKFKEAFLYTPENARLWRDVLEAGKSRLGPAMRTGFCYWATEPTDNPDYFKFIDDFYGITGVMPQTTSAAPLKDLTWTRQLIDLYRKRRSIPSRFSILSLKTLHTLHKMFTPEELLEIELIQQQKGSVIVKTQAGRMLRGPDKGHTTETDRCDATGFGTIACVSGFLVNMVKRTIRLVSPCRASERWPKGYRIHSEGTFGNAREFAEFIDRSVQEHMPERLNADHPLRFRPDLGYSPGVDGFTVSTRFKSHTLSGRPYLAQMGDMIRQGDRTVYAVISELVNSGADMFAAGASLQDLFDLGLLDDDPACAEPSGRACHTYAD